MAAHALFILDLKGRVILNKNYRGDLPSNVAQRFTSKILEEEEVNLKPVIEDEGYSYIYVRHTNVYRKTVD
jgi:AP-1 complex subunit mu